MTADLTPPPNHNGGGWRKSSHSGQDGGCIEIAGTLKALRDSKDPAGPALASDKLSIVGFVRWAKADLGTSRHAPK